MVVLLLVAVRHDTVITSAQPVEVALCQPVACCTKSDQAQNALT